MQSSAHCAGQTGCPPAALGVAGMSAPLVDHHVLLNRLQAELPDGRIGIGAAVRQLRTKLTGLRRDQFARTGRISLNALQQLEHDQGNPTAHMLGAAFSPFGIARRCRAAHAASRHPRPSHEAQPSASTSPSSACAVTSGPAPGPWITSGWVL